MSASRLFVERVVQCPACGAKSLLAYPDPKLYRAVKRESDLHVLAYEWSAEGARGVVPHHYFAWQCEACLFADVTEAVESGQGSYQDHALRLAFRQALDPGRQEALAALRALVPKGPLDGDGAAALHAAALLVSLLPAERNIDQGRLGRVALRLAWLFRERGGPEQEPEPDSGALEALRAAVERLDAQVAATGLALDGTAEAARARAGEAGGEDAESAPYLAVTASMAAKLAEVKTLLAMLQSAVLQEGQHLAHASAEGASAGALDEALARAKGRFPLVPRSERDCLRLAVDGFVASYRQEDTYLSIEQSMTVLGLVVDLLVRLGEDERALEFVAEIFNAGMENKKELTRRLAEGKRGRRLRAHDERMLDQKIGVVTMAIRQAGESRRRILDRLLERHRAVIVRTLSATAGGSAEAREKALADAGVPEVVVTQLKIRKEL